MKRENCVVIITPDAVRKNQGKSILEDILRETKAQLAWEKNFYIKEGSARIIYPKQVKKKHFKPIVANFLMGPSSVALFCGKAGLSKKIKKIKGHFALSENGVLKTSGLRRKYGAQVRKITTKGKNTKIYEFKLHATDTPKEAMELLRLFNKLDRNQARPYQPFGQTKGFFIKIHSVNDKTIINKENNYKLLIRPSGHMPKMATLLCNYLSKRGGFKKSTILEVGTGETATIAIHLAKLGAKKITAIEPNPVAIRWAQKNIRANKLEKIIKATKLFVGDYRTRGKFDFMISNPPQMPTKRKKSLHDDGGKDGKQIIKQIIKLAELIIIQNGWIIFTAFDFLGVDKSFNQQPSIFELLKRRSFRPKIVESIKKPIKPTSYTFQNIKHIKKEYPLYRFLKDGSGLLHHKIYIVAAKKV
jgi:tRNA1(Val) A37 N6-methylase TrmN6/nucleoside diphosphate kinase